MEGVTKAIADDFRVEEIILCKHISGLLLSLTLNAAENMRWLK